MARSIPKSASAAQACQSISWDLVLKRRLGSKSGRYPASSSTKQQYLCTAIQGLTCETRQRPSVRVLRSLITLTLLSHLLIPLCLPSHRSPHSFHHRCQIPSCLRARRLQDKLLPGTSLNWSHIPYSNTKHHLEYARHEWTAGITPQKYTPSLGWWEDGPHSETVSLKISDRFVCVWFAFCVKACIAYNKMCNKHLVSNIFLFFVCV